MNRSYPFSELQRFLTRAQNILVLIPTTPTFDQVASSLALYLALAKSGKQVSVLAPEEMIVEFSSLIGVDKVGSKIPGGELTLTINRPIENIEKVTSHEEGGKLSLAIRPKPGLPPVKKEDIVFSSVGAEIDLVFLVEAGKLESLGKIYQENENLFKEKPIVSLGRQVENNKLGQLSFVDPRVSACSEIVVEIIKGLNLPLDEEIGSNLLLGLANATQNFQSQAVTAETFEAAAFCLRAGAKRVQTQRENEIPPSSDWLEPKIYKGSTLP